jgi:dihydrofolate reductase
MAAHWKTAAPSKITTFMNALPKLVASRTLKSVDWKNSRVTADIVSEITHMKAAETKPIYVFGSADLIHSLLEAELVDEIMLCVVPVLLGRGTPLFKPGQEIGLELNDSRTLQSGSVINNYRVRSAV